MGRLKYIPIEVKMELFPADSVDVEVCMAELHQNGLIEIYTDHSGAALVQVLNFTKHQNPHVNERIGKDKKPLPCLPSAAELDKPKAVETEEKPSIEQRVKAALVVLSEYSESDPADSLDLIPYSLIPHSLIADLPPKPTTPPASPVTKNFQTQIDDWTPAPTTMEALHLLHKIPDQFIAEQLIEFKTYWCDRADAKTSWDAAFLQRCPQQWKRYGAEWLSAPVAETGFINKHTDNDWAKGLQ
jgi:hypothetical protein